MKIHVYTLTFNEEMLLPYLLRHYGQFAERIFVADDSSTDCTREIAQADPKVTLIDMPYIDGHFYADTNEQWGFYKKYSRGVADWVIVCDADEFVYHPDIVGALRVLKEQGYNVVHNKGYTMLADHMPTTDGQIYDEIRLGLPDMWMTKESVFDPVVDMTFRTGRHWKANAKHSAGGHVRRAWDTGINILHYRYFGQAWYDERTRRNQARQKFAPVTPHRNINMPDGTRNRFDVWVAEHWKDAVSVV